MPATKFAHGVYRRSDGNVFNTLLITVHPKTGERLVVYCASDFASDKMSRKYACPLADFSAYVDDPDQGRVKCYEPC